MDKMLAILLDGSVGIYLPREFAKHFAKDWQGIDPDDLEILRAGPDHEWYWETWDDVLATASYADDDGHTWTLFQDGDLFAVRDDHEFED